MNDNMDTVTLDPDDPFEAVVIRMVETNRRKRADYAGDGNVFQNFIDSAYQTGTTPGASCETLIATKQARLRNLLGSGKTPQNESVADTILDRAVYSTLSLAMYEQGLYTGIPSCSATVDFPLNLIRPMRKTSDLLEEAIIEGLPGVRLSRPEARQAADAILNALGEGEKTDG